MRLIRRAAPGVLSWYGIGRGAILASVVAIAAFSFVLAFALTSSVLAYAEARAQPPAPASGAR